MLPKAFEDLVGNGRAGGAQFGPGDGLHLGEDLADALACGGIPIAHGVDLMEQASDPLSPGPGPGDEMGGVVILNCIQAGTNPWPIREA